MSEAEIESVLAFWFAEGRDAQWFERDEAFDRAVGGALGALHERAAAGELDHWAAEPEGALALVVLLDQVPRNLFRGTPRAFATDARALAVCRAALAAGHDAALADDRRRIFLYLPLEHSEDLADQERCVALCARLSNPDWLSYAERHRDVIARFGRFPHRNALLGRATTEAEAAFLQQPGSSF
ncbi:Uncharacterized conserved protein, DUF924 family [Tistlia consotensis]|uniref:Uncharacterized conserved protein, DUF924 family n=1 Tax=Tistlia consotensis USBA 355 TaxID=560819 RepID=A0A1Y6C6G3_9PROT|nr:DUF924 family protein [Tistlia consotensis]SMF38702.1 Uncharacterized conserved protein, DUF924 family [Tistlia consotensis USBA 355]SNR36901.1 Uncharacterized conserved protein, DUF924 family [Tistlia consotensis]